ncbi:transposase [uncultured Thiodictyon sp.]|uniref:transposase n=1 Tax=uncultured Thiodictyon sp. TaxID=1846217 RepID=UPI0025E9C681|nr:transposase [uncultured Thiodictyon sp.]
MDRDQNFKNLVLDYPRQALAFFAPYERDYPSEAQTVSSFFQRCRDEGRQQGECAALMRVMHHKFGDIPEPARLRIESADPETLLEWLDRALVAASIDEVIH